MQIQNVFKIENAKPVLIMTSIYLIGRSLYYLATSGGNVLSSALSGQRAIEYVFEVSIPMAAMTIIWPIIFAALNLIHSKIRLNAAIYYSTIAIHVFSVVISAALMINGWDRVELSTGEVIEARQVYSVAIATIFTAVIACWLYAKKLDLFAAPDAPAVTNGGDGVTHQASESGTDLS